MDNRSPILPAGVDTRLQSLAQQLTVLLDNDGIGAGVLSSAGGDDRIATWSGALFLLQAVGLVDRGADERFVVRSRFARLALASIIRMLNQGHSILKDVREADASEYLVSLTSALEQGRVAGAGSLERVDPIHQRRIVNVLLKGRQIRRGKRVDVYLHILHPEWRQ